ncbi:MAG: HEAT repeat domain-containing protein [Gammaproteobacteria bacterium]|nr:HEAT repeat domain-containing protein [Gammaproteobacteria bacterium]
MPSPDAILMLTSQCPHCASVMKSLSEMVKQGDLACLEIINLEQKPEAAEKLGVRTVPWIRIGWFELEGLHSQKELQQKTLQASSEEGALAYISEELLQGRVNKVLSLLDRQHNLIRHALALLGDAEAKINIRLGVGVVMEEYAATDWFAPYIPQLAKYTQDQDERVRADVCHYLSLTNNKETIPYIKPLLDDVSAEVREVAAESLQELGEQDQ